MVLFKNKSHAKEVAKAVEAAGHGCDDVDFVFKDSRRLKANLVFLVSISKFLGKLLDQVQHDDKIVILLPDHSASEFKAIFKSMNRNSFGKIK